jgi:hypothetical protein
VVSGINTAALVFGGLTSPTNSELQTQKLGMELAWTEVNDLNAGNFKV